MDSQNSNILRASFLPFFTPSHANPLVDIARLFATRGVHVSIITTPANALLFQPSLHRHNAAAATKITVHTLKFPAAEVGLPEGVENFNATTTTASAAVGSEPMSSRLHRGIAMLQKPMEDLIRGLNTHCIVSDMFYPWTVELARELNIPRLYFNPSGSFFHCVSHSLNVHAPHERVQSDSETFVIPGLPHPIQMTRSQLPDHVKYDNGYKKLKQVIQDSEIKSFGSIVNTFYELEKTYTHHFREVVGRKCWIVGPLSQFANRLVHKSSSSDSAVMTWLATQKPNSVLFACFGSMARFSVSQLSEIGYALEASGHPFVWVVRKNKTGNEEEEEEKWGPHIVEKGIIVREWASQAEILEHAAVGGFLSHCGWNSVMETVVAGVPLVTWPLFSEQFYNAKLITQVLNIGVEIGVEVWNAGFDITSPIVGRDKIERGIRQLMDVSEEAEEMRERAKQLGLMANKAIEDGGSSDSDLTALIDEIKAYAFDQKM